MSAKIIVLADERRKRSKGNPLHEMMERQYEQLFARFLREVKDYIANEVTRQ